MSTSAIGNVFSNLQLSNLSFQLQKSQFQQLGQDLTSGNLSAAQSDFATLQQAVGQIPTATSTSSSNPVAQAFQQLSSDLKSGNLSAAQQDYSAIQQKANSFGSSSHTHHHHGTGGASQNDLLQELNQLGQELSSSILSGNTSAARQAYGAPMQMFAEIPQTDGSGAAEPSIMGAAANASALSLLA
ncbi:MAG TPA: hypothetical protein VMX38_10390 [Verrucomicrobiae bacterium]|nr:hypothetical protein [Verrucomicrobiae bacterium]